MAQRQHHRLVIDTNAIVRGVHFERMAQELYTVPEVLAEVRDRQTRSSVLATAVLPDVRVQDPDPEHIRRVTEFARRTGDTSALSDVDIKVIALTLALHDQQEAAPAAPEPEPEPEPAMQAEEQPMDDGEGEWITPENLSRVRAVMRSGGAGAVEDDAVGVGCLTADFAMQNVLIQMGLSVVSFDGLHISRARTYALKCFSCFEIVRNPTKVFCPKCGNATLRRVAVETTADGGLREANTAGNRRQPTLRGTVHSLPRPKGGRSAHSAPVFSEDELQHRMRTMPKPKSDDMAASAAANPFGVGGHSGRGPKLSVQEQRRLAGVSGPNPNAPRKRIGKKNKSKPASY